MSMCALGTLLNCVRRDSMVYADRQSYMAFLKQNFFRCQPKFYAVLAESWVWTDRGRVLMVGVNNDTMNPAYQVLAECVVNNRTMYVYNDVYFEQVVFPCDECLLEFNLDQIFSNTIAKSASGDVGKGAFVMAELTTRTEDIIDD